MTDRILNQMFKLHIIEEEEEEIYRFGLEGLTLKLLHYISYLFIAAFSHVCMPFFVFFTAFLLLRKSAGGYHARTKTGCYIGSCLTVAVVIMYIKAVTVWSDKMLLYIIFDAFMILSAVIVWRIAPLGNRNRDLDEAEIKYFRKRTLILLVGGIISMLLFTIMKQEQYAAAILLAFTCQALLLVIEKTRIHLRTRNRKDAIQRNIVSIILFVFLAVSFLMTAEAKEQETKENESQRFAKYQSQDEQNTEIVIVLDCSQSMENVDSQYKIPDFVKELSAIVPRNYSIGVVAYNEEVCLSLPVGSCYEDIEENLNNTVYKQYGNAGAGLLEAVGLLENESADRRILMISDGEIMMKTEEQTEESAEAYTRAVKKAQNQDIVIDVVALGQRIEEGYTVYSAAEDTGGQIYELTNSEELASLAEQRFIPEWKIKKSNVGTLTGTGGELSVKLPDCCMEKAKILLLGEPQNENLTVNCKADEINIYKGENYTVVEVHRPESEEIKIQMSSEQSMDIKAYLVAEYDLLLTTGYTYIPGTNAMTNLGTDTVADTETGNADILTEDETDTEIDTDIGMAQIWLTVENPYGENLLEGHLDDSRLKVYLNEKECEYTIEDGKLWIQEETTQDLAVTLRVEPDGLYGNYYGTLEVSRQIIVPQPIEEPEPIDWFFWLVIGAFVIAMLLLFILARKRSRAIPRRRKFIDESRILPRESSANGNDFCGKIQVYVIHSKNDIDYPPESINLFARCNREMITLEWILDTCNLPLTLKGAEKIIIRPGADKSLIIKNNSKAAALMGKELLLKGHSYHLYYHEKVTFIFDQEDTEIEVHYKDLKPNER